MSMIGETTTSSVITVEGEEVEGWKRQGGLEWIRGWWAERKEVVSSMESAGFKGFDFAQTIFHDLRRLQSPEAVRQGYGEGSFIVVRGVKSTGQD